MDAQKALLNLADALVEDIMELSDEEIMQEMLEDLGSPEAVEAELERIRLLFDEALERAL